MEQMAAEFFKTLIKKLFFSRKTQNEHLSPEYCLSKFEQSVIVNLMSILGFLGFTFSLETIEVIV